MSQPSLARLEEEKLGQKPKCIHVSTRTARSSRYSMVRVHRDTLVKLQKLKARYRAKSINQLINRLIAKSAKRKEEGWQCRDL